MTGETYDIVVVGGGTAGAFAAATAGTAGMDVVLLERKSEAKAGHIACGDGLKGTDAFPDVIDLDRLRDESFTNRAITRGIFYNPKTDEEIDLPFEGIAGAVVDRKRYGEVLLDEANRAGAEIHYDTVVQDVIQTDAGRVTGVVAVGNGKTKRYTADVVIDCAGALSILQDRADLSDATFDTDVTYSQFCSAYREIVDVRKPVPWDDALYFKPTEQLGYLWYFPRTPTRLNVGVGFQMNKPPMELVETLKRDMRRQPEFEGVTVRDKLGAALPTRRPYDSAVAPGFMAAGDAAGHVNPCTGGGIAGAAHAGYWAAEHAVGAIDEGDVGEDALWGYNRAVMSDFGRDFAAMDLYNIWGGAHTVDELVDVISAVPAAQLVEVMAEKGTTSLGPLRKLGLAARLLGHRDVLLELYRLSRLASELKSRYDAYPRTPDGFSAWRADRDSVMEEVYAVTGTDPKY